MNEQQAQLEANKRQLNQYLDQLINIIVNVNNTAVNSEVIERRKKTLYRLLTEKLLELQAIEKEIQLLKIIS